MSLIPKKIYQSWKTKKLPPKMQEAVGNVRTLNPDYDYELYDDDDCRNFLLVHFGENYANAFDSLIPGAFKCDFWRYAVLYVNGGVYLDIDMVPLVPFDNIIGMKDTLVSIVDQKNILRPNCAIYQAFIACVPKHPVLLQALQLTFANIVSKRVETFDNLSVTGPVVMGIAMNLYWRNKDPHNEMKPGKYGTIILYSMKMPYSYDLDGKKIFQNKFDGYDRGLSLDYTTVDHYTDDPRKTLRNIVKYTIILIVVFLLIVMINSNILGKKLKECRSSLTEGTD
jgi:hypothetical protein